MDALKVSVGGGPFFEPRGAVQVVHAGAGPRLRTTVTAEGLVFDALDEAGAAGERVPGSVPITVTFEEILARLL